MEVTPATVTQEIDPEANLQVQIQDEYPDQLKYMFPYKSHLSFHLLVEHWKKLLGSPNLTESSIAKEIIKRLEKAPELLGDIEEKSILDKHRELVYLLVSGFFPMLKDDNYMGIIGYPFDYKFVYRSSAVKELMEAKGMKAFIQEDADKMMCQKIISSCIKILNTYYGQNIKIDMSMMFSLKDEKTGLDFYYQGKIDTNYLAVRQTAPLKKISEESMKKLLSNTEDIDFWLEQLPPDNFEFAGLVQIKLTDISEEQAYNNLKLSLLEKNVVVDQAGISKLEQQLRNYLNSTDLKLGIAGKGYGKGDQFGIDSGLWNSLLPMTEEYFNDDPSKSLYRKAVRKGSITVVDDLRKNPNPSLYEKALIKEGFLGLIIAPLFDEAQNLVGVLELGSRDVCGFHAVKTGKLQEILPVFTVALQRAIEEKGNQVEVLIKHNYTSIHPSVEWRFIKAANEMIKKKKLNPDHDVPEPINFKDVYPLYGQSDIVGSSTTRNAAIQEDLLENLRILKETLGPVEACLAFPLVGVYQYRVDKYIESLNNHISSGDEVRISEFLTDEINPLLDNLSKHMPEYKESVEAYKQKLDPALGVVYTNRKAYEESVTLINETLARLINHYQVSAQQVLPHYFEMYKTDGVEYNMYMGKSLLNGQEFDNKYIENIRLWQLMLMIAITRKVDEIQPKLQMPLRTAELILAFSNKISIRFKTEEKQFDVDGAYNIRYEVIKKRIDKSRIKGTNERLTQAGKIAIVFTQEKEKREYLRFFEYLKAERMIEQEVEVLQIEDLQGVSGLQALRVKVIV